MNIQIMGVVEDSIVDGPGLRLAIFTQGCFHHCVGCHNPQSHDPNGGKAMDTDELIAMMDSNPLLDGITLTGGDPFEQPEPCAVLAKAAHERGLNVWTYTGYLWEQLIERENAQALLWQTDVLVDGPFVLSKRSLELRFCGSSNQRLIDVAASSNGRGIVLWNG